MNKLTAALTLAAGLAAVGNVLGASTVQLDKMAVGTAIDNKELAGTATEFDSSVQRLYCWSKVTAANPPAKITHVWYADGTKEAEVPLDIKYPTVRTWSSKSVWPAKWKVEVLSDSGESLGTSEFTVKSESNAAPKAEPKAEEKK
jgi:hypothetical protein